MRASSAFFFFSQSSSTSKNVVARDEADAGVVGDHQVAGLDADLAHLNFAVDLDGLDAPFAGDRRDLARPDRITDAA